MPPPSPSPPLQHLPSQDADLRNWSMWLHLSGLSSYVLTATPLIGLVAPIVIWQMKKDIMPKIDGHGKDAVNFHLSLLLYAFAFAIIAIVFSFVTLGFGAIIMVPLGAVVGGALWILGLLFPILAAKAASRGQTYKYPLTIDFFRLFA